jgi:hypothetical protein
MFSFSALTPSVKTLGPISIFAPIGMLDMSSTLALTPSVKWALEFYFCRGLKERDNVISDTEISN